ncbi:3-methylaspartate ammonia-lyase [Ligilactobacillus salitolerans]|uniref:3-methylaspartate ammonia-lyase n=1 Tax=Ligilactobacillus salitolerans TaxID=1808352 RepID=A0A401IVW7_9LACO|nr:acyclic terpene utilization AtuA family protein [Ligilactobacillus salitolerans]GBG95684.1 3-methylaspartate ammonia-lyase [Ligilactobacillus salitolerans]
MEELRVLVPNGMLGYGFPLADFERGMQKHPHGIVVDAGSTDSGPQKLALGEMTCPESAYYKELSILVPAAKKAGIPLMVSSAGGDGTNQHVDLFGEIVAKIAAEQKLSLRVAKIYSDVSKIQIKDALEAGKIKAMQNVPHLENTEIDAATVITAQMGAEPYLKLLRSEQKPDVIIGGRTYDPSPTAALGIYYGFDPALAWHMGKIIECGAICCVPAGKTVLGTLHKDHFLIEPLSPDSKALPHTVAAHTMYEKSSALNLPGPGGVLNLESCEFKAETERITRISGSRFIQDKNYTVKLEGAKVVGYRSITVMGLRDPILIDQVDDALTYVKEETQKELPQECAQSQIIFHPYGKNATMKNLESLTDEPGHEMCVIAEVASPTQEMAQLVVNRIRTTLLHYGYPGRIATSGNIGMPFTPLEIPLGKVCQFNIYHLMQINDPVAQFPVTIQEVGNK